MVVAISQLKPGDKVLATNTRTGKTQAEPVDAVLVHHDTDLFDLTLTVGGHVEVIHTTANHLFWNPATQRWARAITLAHGTRLRTASGVAATVIGGESPADRTGWMWDLTVANDHDFYVHTTTVSVLVHNCPAPKPSIPKWKKVTVIMFNLFHTVLSHPTVGDPPDFPETVYQATVRGSESGQGPLPGTWPPPDEDLWIPPEP